MTESKETIYPDFLVWRARNWTAIPYKALDGVLSYTMVFLCFGSSPPRFSKWEPIKVGGAFHFWPAITSGHCSSANLGKAGVMIWLQEPREEQYYFWWRNVLWVNNTIVIEFIIIVICPPWTLHCQCLGHYFPMLWDFKKSESEKREQSSCAVITSINTIIFKDPNSG